MRLEAIGIKCFRSIENIKIRFPKEKPVVIFGPNNVGKSNLLKAIDIMIGEKFPTYTEFEDSDYFQRDKCKNEEITLLAAFDEPYHIKSSYNSPEEHKIIYFSSNRATKKGNEHIFHDGKYNQLYIKGEERSKCQLIFIDATRDISRHLSYFSQYSLLSKMSKKMHQALVDSKKIELKELFGKIKTVFESVDEYKIFYKELQDAFSSSIDGFEHKLEIDLSAYDPNNYFKKVIAREGEAERSFEEFGTGEQQILLMAFMKAYAQTFKGETFILGIEEPESHLHPLAQRWLAKNIKKMCSEGLQVIITTHSPEFLDIEGLEGFVKVHKVDGVTKIVQNDAKKLSEKCIEYGADSTKTNCDSILKFYKSNTFYDQLKGFFARKILLVEGATEVFALPMYFERAGYDLIKNGTEIIDCRGKSSIPRLYRLFKAYDYQCFALFDGDASKSGNDDLSKSFGFDSQNMNRDNANFSCHLIKGYGYFGKDFENYMRNNISEYSSKESQLSDCPKPYKAKIIAEENSFIPDFVHKIAESLGLQK